MRTPAASQNVLAAVFLAAAVSPSPVSAAPTPPDKDAAVGAVPNPREGLDRTVTLRLDKRSLSAAVAQVRDLTKLNIVLDSQALQQIGVSPDQPAAAVPVDLKDVKVRSALRTLLAPYDLTFVLVGESIIITTEDAAAARQMGQRISVHLDKVEFAAALKQMAHDTGVNLALDPHAEKEASVRVSLDVEDMPLETVVRLLAEMAGLKPVRAANTLFVTKKEVAVEMRADPDLNPPRQVASLIDLDMPLNAPILRAQGRLNVVAPGVMAPPAPVGAGAPVSVKSTDETAPANPDLPPAPEKKDGDK